MESVESKKLVFVVDDSKAVRDAAAIFLNQLGYRTKALEGGAQCLAALAEERPFAILLDLSMDPMRGDDCCRSIKESPDSYDVPVIILTGANAPHEVMHCWRAAADDFLPKPLALASLKAKLDAVEGSDQEEPARHPSAKRILYIDDSRFFRRVLGSHLEHAGFHVIYAANGAEALDVARKEGAQIDLCLSDVVMPGMDGLAVIQELRTLPSLRGKPMVLVSGMNNPVDLLQSAEALTGGPIVDRRGDVERVVARVAEALSQPSLNLRSSERAPFFAIVEMCMPEMTLTGFSYDVSAGGIFIRTLAVAPHGQAMALRLSLSAVAEPTVSDVTVAWSNPFRRRTSFSYPVGMGLRWVKVAPELERHLSRLIGKAMA